MSSSSAVRGVEVVADGRGGALANGVAFASSRPVPDSAQAPVRHGVTDHRRRGVGHLPARRESLELRVVAAGAGGGLPRTTTVRSGGSKSEATVEAPCRCRRPPGRPDRGSRTRPRSSRSVVVGPEGDPSTDSPPLRSRSGVWRSPAAPKTGGRCRGRIASCSCAPSAGGSSRAQPATAADARTRGDARQRLSSCRMLHATANAPGPCRRAPARGSVRGSGAAEGCDSRRCSRPAGR